MKPTKKRPTPKRTKERISICLDDDVLAYFRKLGRRKNAKPYQVQINDALRDVMEGEGTDSYAALVNDKEFIAAVAVQVLKLSRKGSKR